MDETTSTDRSPVVVGTDGTNTALRAVAWAAAEAAARQAPLRIVHAAPYASSTSPAGRRRADAILGHALTTARQHGPHVEIDIGRLDEQPAAALARASERAGLLVIGMISGKSGEVVLGSLAYSVVAEARCPVTVVRSHHRVRAPSLPVMVGVQDIAADAPAVSLAFADAERHGTTLIVAHVRHSELRERIMRSESDERVAQTIGDSLAPWRVRHPRVPVDVRILHGAPAQELLKLAEVARLAVVASHGRGAPARALLGSTSRLLLRLGPCPITIVRRDAMAAAAAPLTTDIADEPVVPR